MDLKDQNLKEQDPIKRSLQELGWKDFFQKQIDETEQDLLPARVSRQDVNRYHLLSAEGPLIGTIPGRLHTMAISKADLPTVGDWVLTSSADKDDSNART